MTKNKFVKYCSLFLSLVLVLCCLVSAADTITVTVSNPDNVPFDFNGFVINDQVGQFGNNILPAVYDQVSIIDGYIDVLDLSVLNIPDGDYYGFLYYYTNDVGDEGAYLMPSDYVVSDQTYIDLYGNDVVANFYVVSSSENLELVVSYGSTQPCLSYVMIPAPPKVTDSIENVWTGILTFVVDSLGSVGGLFYNSDTGLTFLGTLGIIGLSFGLGLLIFYFVSKFLRLRG